MRQLGNLSKYSEGFAMIKHALHIGIVFYIMIVMASCTAKGGDPVVQRYTKALQLTVSQAGHPQYSSRVIGEVFINMGLIATNQKRYSGEPPFKISMGLYSLTPDVSHVKLLSVEMFVNNSPGIDILGHFPVLEMDTDVSSSRADFDQYGDYGAVHLITDYFISAAPVDDDHVKIIIKIQVSPDHVGEVIFNFVPQVLSGTPRGFPA
ncbi:MAG: hypothetical protein JKX70_02025 [Phycisphaerales bacterium]|nr:hypothetical protein [Phycisphaerales bacterium]